MNFSHDRASTDQLIAEDYETAAHVAKSPRPVQATPKGSPGSGGSAPRPTCAVPVELRPQSAFTWLSEVLYRVLERSVALLVLVVLSPLFAVVAVLIRLIQGRSPVA